MTDLDKLAERCFENAVNKTLGYLKDGDRVCRYNGTDRLDDAEKLLNIAASLRALSMMKVGG